MATSTRETTTVCLPALGEGVDAAVITRWLRDPGDRVEAGEPLLEVATDKVDTEIPSPASGLLVDVLVHEDDSVAVGADIARIASDAAPEVVPPTDPRPRADDRVAAAPTDTAAPDTQKLSRLRRTIASRMMESLQTSAQLTTVFEVDVTAIARLRQEHKADFLARTGVKLSFLPFFARAAIDALADHRVLNASVNADVTEITHHPRCHLGIAVDGERGLMVPVIRDAQDLRIDGLAQAIADKADRVRAGTITVDELTGGTFTLTNTGSRGALFDTPIINLPQTGILGTGAVVERLAPTRVDGALGIEVRSFVHLAVSYDHRVVDGADASRFLGSVKHSLENGFQTSDLL